jgi:succinylglutamate desuccinylase
VIKVKFNALDAVVETDREIGCYTQHHPGPLLLITAGIHGNEASGIIALNLVFRFLNKYKVPIRGTFVGLCGNVEALDKEQRFIDQDLNRTWGEKEVEKIQNVSQEELNSEQREAKAILNYIAKLDPDKYEDKFFVDCHTTSSESIPYFSVEDTAGCLSFARRFPVHSVLGFAKMIPTTIDGHFCRNGFSSFTLEAGQHYEISSVENCEAVIFLALVQSGCIESKSLDCYDRCRNVLARLIMDDKKTFDIIHRHEIKPGDNFSMEPGFVNFQKITRDELLAKDKNGEILSKWDARILMPLYQKQGDDGFFVIEERGKG